MKKKYKNKNFKQASFYFEDYLETNKKNQVLKKTNNFQDRIYLLFFFFFSLILIFSIKITHISFNKKDIFNVREQKSQFSLLRRDIVDRNGVIISRNIKTFHAAINPKLIKDKKNFLTSLAFGFLASILWGMHLSHIGFLGNEPITDSSISETGLLLIRILMILFFLTSKTSVFSIIFIPASLRAFFEVCLVRLEKELNKPFICCRTTEVNYS